MSDGSGLQYDVSELSAYDFFNYWPSLALACIALSLFFVAAVAVGWLTERRKGHRFVHTVTATALLEVAGYVALVYVVKESGKGSVFSAYVVMQVFIIEAPNILQACLYVTIAKVLALSPGLTRGRKLLRGWVVATTFAFADVIAIIVQAIGISIWAASQSSGEPDQAQIRLGCAITLAGLAAQLLCFVGFTILTIWTQRHPGNGLRGTPEARQLFLGMYLAMAGLYIRNIFRFAEFTQATILTWPAPEGAYVLSEQQVLFYTLDCLPILLAVTTYVFIHPGYLLPAPEPKAAGSKAVADAAAAAEAGAAGSANSSDGSGREAQGGDESGEAGQDQFKVVALD